MEDISHYTFEEAQRRRQREEEWRSYCYSEIFADIYWNHKNNGFTELPEEDMTDEEVVARVNGYMDFQKEIREGFEVWRRQRQQEHARKPGKQYAFTLTTNLTKEQIQQDMVEAAHKLFRQQTVPIREGEAYLEYTEEDRPHIHGWYETEDGGRVFAKIFRRCWQYWGEKSGKTKFAGGYHEIMKTNRYKGYSASEGRVICIKKINQECIYYDAPIDYQAPSSPPQGHYREEEE